MNNINKKKKIYITIGAVIIFAAYFCYMLGHAVNVSKCIKHYPVLTDSAIYTELQQEDELCINLNMKKSIHVGAISYVLVNINKESDGYLDFTIEGEGIDPVSLKLYEKDIDTGVWNSTPVDMFFKENSEYTLRIKAVDCNPYFMYVPERGLSLLPYDLDTVLNGDEIDSVSLGLVETTDEAHVNSMYIFILGLIVIMLVVLLCLLWFDLNGSDLFLLFVFIFICVSVYEAAFKNGIFITADSSGYLREAVNLKAGNGYSYDGLAGYRSWFANWPILYPFFIFLVMLITGKEAYIASKILSCILVLLIIFVFRLRYKNKAYLYAIPLLNFGFIELTHYTWSEMPFILFLILFGYKLGDIVSDKNNKFYDYILLSLYGFLIFLTRYFGIYVWAVVGLYVLYYGWNYLKSKDVQNTKKAAALSISAVAGAVLSFSYMFINKKMNGYASGVSRSEWWDDYRTLTKDLIDSLVVEVFNVLHIDTSLFIKQINYPVKVIFLLVIIGVIIWFIVRNIKINSSNAVFILMAAVYYVMFTVIRYFSSMDTFYFRFFEPASFLLTVGLLGIAESKIGKAAKYSISFIVLALVLIGTIKSQERGLMWTKLNYYDICKDEWDKQYKEVNEHSVVIFSDLDFRSEYYRPDVINGEILTEDSLDDLRRRYYGSEYLVIQKEYAEAMVDCGEYKEDVSLFLEDGLRNNPDVKKYISMKIN